LQLGWSHCDFLRANRIPLRIRLEAQPDATEEKRAALACHFTQLPIAAQSVDLVVLPHVLEFDPEPHQILREVERILRPEGQLFILGFNPFSLFGLARRLHAQEDGFPWNGQYLSVSRLKDWLKLLGFELDRGAFGCYAPPARHEHWLNRWHFMEAAGDRWWSFAGGVYLLRAIKRVYGMRLILPAFRVTNPLKAKVLTPVTRHEAPRKTISSSES
jgi:SAM-dependent methyltransferase